MQQRKPTLDLARAFQELNRKMRNTMVRLETVIKELERKSKGSEEELGENLADISMASKSYIKRHKLV